MPKKLTIEIIKKRLYDKTQDIEIISDEYINSSEKLMCKCKIDNHQWLATWESLNNGNGCPKCAGTIRLTLDEIKSDLKKSNEHITIVSDEYKNNRTKLLFICNICGYEWASMWSSLKRSKKCPKCTNKVRLTIEEIKERLSKINSNITITSEEYVNNSTKLDCLCKIDGHKWMANWANLSQGWGCPMCKARKVGWSRTLWMNGSETSNNFDSFKLYIIKCYNEFESFYKIGITFLPIKMRYKDGSSMPYNYDVVKIIESGDGAYIYNLENKLHVKHKAYKYYPNIKFKGSLTECFSQLIQEEVDSLG